MNNAQIAEEITAGIESSWPDGYPASEQRGMAAAYIETVLDRTYPHAPQGEVAALKAVAFTFESKDDPHWLSVPVVTLDDAEAALRDARFAPVPESDLAALIAEARQKVQAVVTASHDGEANLSALYLYDLQLFCRTNLLRLCTALEASEAARVALQLEYEGTLMSLRFVEKQTHEDAGIADQLVAVTAELDALKRSRDNWKERRVEAVKGQQAISAHDGTIIADVQERLAVARDALRQAKPHIQYSGSASQAVKHALAQLDSVAPPDAENATENHVSMGVIDANGERYVVTVMGRKEAIVALIALTAVTSLEGTWEWALEQMKAGHSIRLNDWEQGIAIEADEVTGQVAFEDGDHYQFHVTEFDRTDWQIVETGTTEVE